jgi:hypothetical protein
VSWGGGILAGLLETAARPAWWVIALAGFLARGGILVVLAPIVVLPSTFGLATGLSPLVTQVFVAGDVGLLALLGAGGVLVVIGLVLLGGSLGAVTEVALVREAAIAISESAAPGADQPEAGLATRVLAVRLLANVPLLLAVIWGGVAIVVAAYAELTLPGDVGLPLLDRVVARAWPPLLLVVVTWLAGDAVGAVGARRAVLRDESAGTALVRCLPELVRRPAGWIATLALTTATAVLVTAGCLLASNVAWGGLRVALDAPDAIPVLLSLTVFVLTWLGALLVIGFVTAWRSAAMTAEALRGVDTEAVEAQVTRPLGSDGDGAGGSVPNGDGTFGAPGGPQSGGWSAPRRGGSL